MVLKLYGHPVSICTRRVRIVLEEKKVQYELIVVDFLKGEHLSEPYGIEFHPFKKIPVLVDTESGVKVFGQADEEVVKARLDALDNAFEGYERILSKQNYLAGNDISLADLFHLPFGVLVEEAGFAGFLPKYPAVRAWWEGLKARDSWKTVSAAE
ncbi:hypothetical protein FDECE_4761 [Fusarium decemcellulare]|nr:hypothetical protein FDECE_4761 [Fusarium decemcellulare]